MSQNVSNIVNRGVSRSTVQTNLLDSKLTLFCCNFRYFTILLPAIRSDQSMAGYIDCCFFLLSLVTDILAMVAPIGMKFCVMEYMCPGCVISFFGGGTPRDPQNPKFWPSKKSKYLENCKSQHYVSIRA